MSNTTALSLPDDDGRSAYDKIIDVPVFLKQMGRAIALSKMFGIDTVEQGEILALECLARKIPPLALAERYHFICGKLSKKSEAMLAEFRSMMGGEYEIIERSPDVAAIALTLKGKREEFKLTWEEAQGEPFPYEGTEKAVVKMLASNKRPELKTKYATPRSRMQMLWARVVSDGIRAVAAEAVCGAYTPEEIEDFDEVQEEATKSTSKASKPKQATTVEVTSVVTQPTVSSGSTTQAQETKPVESVPFETKPTEPILCNSEQINRIMELLEIVQPEKEKVDGILARRGVSHWRQLTTEQASQIIGGLTQLADEKAAEIQAATSIRNDDPATEEQVRSIKQLASEIEQNDPGFSAKIVEKLHAANLTRLADLTVSEADQLISQLGIKNISSFIEASLLGHARAKAAVTADPTSQPTGAKSAA